MIDFLQFGKAIGKRWWALMSCAVFTFLGLYVALMEKSNRWLLVASVLAAIGLFIVAAFGAWHDELTKARELHRKLEAMADDRLRGAKIMDVRVKISQFAADGTRLKDEAPSSPGEVPTWKSSVNQWATEARNFLDSQCSPLASQKFLDTNDINDATFPGKHNLTWRTLLALGKMIGNLREIMEQDVYLSRT